MLLQFVVKPTANDIAVCLTCPVSPCFSSEWVGDLIRAHLPDQPLSERRGRGRPPVPRQTDQ